MQFPFQQMLKILLSWDNNYSLECNLGFEESNAGEVNKFCNQIEQVAIITGNAVNQLTQKKDGNEYR